MSRSTKFKSSSTLTHPSSRAWPNKTLTLAMAVTRRPQFWREMMSNSLWECQKKNVEREKNLVEVVEISKVLRHRSMPLQDPLEVISPVNQVKVIRIAHPKQRLKIQNLRRPWYILEKLIKQMIVMTHGKKNLARNLSFRSIENQRIVSMVARGLGLTMEASFRVLPRMLRMTKFKKNLKETTIKTWKPAQMKGWCIVCRTYSSWSKNLIALTTVRPTIRKWLSLQHLESPSSFLKPLKTRKTKSKIRNT